MRTVCNIAIVEYLLDQPKNHWARLDKLLLHRCWTLHRLHHYSECIFSPFYRLLFVTVQLQTVLRLGWHALDSPQLLSCLQVTHLKHLTKANSQSINNSTTLSIFRATHTLLLTSASIKTFYLETITKTQLDYQLADKVGQVNAKIVKSWEKEMIPRKSTRLRDQLQLSNLNWIMQS